MFPNKRFQVLTSFCLKVAQNCSKEMPKSSARHRHNLSVFRGYHEKNENLYKNLHLPCHIFFFKRTSFTCHIWMTPYMIADYNVRRANQIFLGAAADSCLVKLRWPCAVRVVLHAVRPGQNSFFFEEVIQHRTRSRIQAVLIWILHRCTCAP
jgi:hypothetical protein